MRQLGKWTRIAGSALLIGGAIVSASAQTTASSKAVLADGLSNAAGVAVDAMGNLYYSDSVTGSVQELPGANGTNTTLLSVSLASGSQLAVDTAQNVYAAGGNADVVYEYTYSNGAFNVNSPISIGTGLGKVTGVAVDLNGNLYIVDAGNKQVVEETKNGSTYTQSVILSNLTAPQQIAVDRAGGIYVADSGANAIVYQPAGGTPQKLGTGLNAPQGVAVDANTDIFIADTGNGALKEIPAGAAQITLPFTLTSPTAVAVDSRGSLYVAAGTNVLHLSVGAIYFGLVPAGQTSGTVQITLSFASQVAPASVQVVTTGIQNLDFKDAGNSTCTSGTVFSAGSSCVMNVTFTPPVPGPRMGAIVFYDSGNKVVSRTFLGGGGLGPMMTFDPGSASAVTPANAGALVYPNNSNTNPYPTAVSQPHGARFDGAGNMFVADTLENRVVVYPANASQSQIFPVTGTANETIDDVAVDGAGDIIVPNLSGRIELYPYENGTWSAADLVVLGTGYTKPRAVAVDVGGNVFTCDTGANKIYEISPALVQTQIAPGVTKACLGVAVDLYGNVGVTDSTGNSAFYIPVNGLTPYAVGSGYSSPWGVIFDASGSMYVTNNTLAAIIRVPDLNGSLKTTAQKLTGNKDYGLAIDAYGNIVHFPTSSSAGNPYWNLLSRSGPSTFFPGVAFAATTTAKAFTVENSGNQAPVYTDGLVTLGDIDDFNVFTSITGAGTLCNFSTTLAPGDSCYLGVIATPTSSGARTEYLQIPTQTPYTPQAELTYTSAAATPSGTASLSLTVSPAAPKPQQAITVTVAAGSGPTGAVTLYVDGKPSQAAELASGSVTFSLPAGLSTGTHTFGATYAGDSSYAPVTKAVVTTITITGVTPTPSIAASATDVSAGQPVTITGAVATGSGLPSPTGTITFNEGSTVLGTGTLSNGSASITTSTLAVGKHTITFSYSGDGVYAAGTSGSVTITVGAYTPTTVTLNVVPAQPGGGYAFGTQLTATATVAPTSGGGTPTGSVLFNLDGTVQSVNLTSNTATLTLTPVAGTHVLSASYSGDATYDASSASASFTTIPAVTQTTLSVSTTYIAAGSNVTLKATVTSPSSQPTGTVIFRNNLAVVGTATLNSSGVATLTTYTLPCGVDPITASYAGDSNDQPSSTAPISITLPCNPTSVVAVSDPVVLFSGSATLTATISTTAPASVIAPIGGSVTFYGNGTLIGTSTVSGGAASYTWTSAVPGTVYSITASYSGDNYFFPSTTQSGFRMYVAPTPPAQYPGDYTITMSPNPFNVTIGTPAHGTLTLSTPGTYFGYVQLTCANLPAYTNCEITPNQVTLDGTTTPQTASITVNSESPDQMARLQMRGSTTMLCGLLIAPLVSLLTLSGFARGRRLLRSAGVRSLSAFLLLVAIGGAVSGCGSHQPLATPPGTYAVTIVATGSGGVNRTTQVQMTFK